MAIKRTQRLYSQQRLDVPSLRNIEASTAADFDSVLRDMMTGLTTPYVLKGFEINLGASTFSQSADNLTINSLGATLLNSTSIEAGTILTVDGNSAEALNTSNSRVSGSFVSGSVNYLSINFIRRAADSTSTVYFYDANSQTEFSKLLPVNTILDYEIVINTTGFGINNPIAIVTTSSGNVPTQIIDSRNMFFRLGTGGVSPDSFHSYPWTQGRTEPGTVATSSAVDIFNGADKNLPTLKEWMDAVMTSIKEIRGSSFWFSTSGGGGGSGGLSLATVNDDANLSTWTGSGTLSHNLSTTGQLVSSSNIFVRNFVTDANFRVNSFTKSLNDGEVLFLNLTRYKDISGNITIDPSGTLPGSLVGLNTRVFQASSVGQLASLTSGTGTFGDWIKAKADSARYFRQIDSFYDSAGSATSSVNATYLLLDSAYTISGASTGSQQTHYNKGNYSASEIIQSTKVGILNTYNVENVYWMAYRDSSSICVRNMGRFVLGETRPVNENTSDNVLNFIGSSNESLTFPVYATDVSGGVTSPSQVNYGGASTDNLTVRVSELSSAMADKAMDKNISMAGGGTAQNTAGLITWSASITVSINGPGVGSTNYIAAGSANLTASYSCAYVTINRNAVSSLPVSVTTFALLPLNENVFAFARKFDTNDVYFGAGGSNYLISDGSNSLSGIVPSSAGSTGGSAIHNWSQEIPTGSINSSNTSFTISNIPYSVTTVLLFRNGLWQSYGTDYSMTNSTNILFNSAPLSGDEIVTLYAQGGTIPFVYCQSITTISTTTSVVSFTPSANASFTLGVAVFVNGLLRQSNTDFTASGTGLGFTFNLVPGATVGAFYTGVNSPYISKQGNFAQSLTSGRTIYSWYSDIMSENSVLVAFDGVSQFAINNTLGLTSSAITINDYQWLSPNILQANATSFTTGTVGYIWAH